MADEDRRLRTGEAADKETGGKTMRGKGSAQTARMSNKRWTIVPGKRERSSNA